MLRHLAKCRLQHPPGDEIYRNRTAKGGVSMYEVRARRPARAVLHPALRAGELPRCAVRMPTRRCVVQRAGRCWLKARPCADPTKHTKPGSTCQVRAAEGGSRFRCEPHLSRRMLRRSLYLPYTPRRALGAAARWTARRRSCTARTCATWPSCSWTTRRSTTTSTSSSSTCCARTTSAARTSSGAPAGLLQQGQWVVGAPGRLPGHRGGWRARLPACVTPDLQACCAAGG